MVNIRSMFILASVALVATASASREDVVGRSLQAVNFRQELLDSINAARKKDGLKAMCINEMLMDAAQIQANDMADNNFIKSAGSDGTLPKDRAKSQGFDAVTVTEVVGAGYRSASSIVAAWVKSSSAKSTLLSKHSVMGPGYAFDKTKKYVHFWAVDFSDGECGDGNATATTPADDSAKDSGSGSVELPTDKPGSGSTAPADASGSGKKTPSSGSGKETPASGSKNETSEKGSGSKTPDASGSDDEAPDASGSDDETPAASGSDAKAPAASASDAETPATRGSGSESPASGSGAPAGTPAPAVVPAGTPAPAVVPAGTPAPGAVPAGTPAPGAVPAGTPAPDAVPAGTPAPGAVPAGTPAPAPGAAPAPPADTRPPAPGAAPAPPAASGDDDEESPDSGSADAPATETEAPKPAIQN